MNAINSIQYTPAIYTQTKINSAEATTRSFSETLAQQIEKVDAASSLKDKLSVEGLFGFKPEKSGAISIDELRQNGEKFLEKFNAEVKKLFVEQGVNIQQEIQLDTDSSGNVVVKNNCADRKKIEQ